MNTQHQLFLTSENIKLLTDTIIEMNVFKKGVSNREIMAYVNQFLTNNTDTKNKSITELNKKFLRFIISKTRKPTTPPLPQLQTQMEPRNLFSSSGTSSSSSQQPIKPKSITIEEIKMDNMALFEKELEIKKVDFENMNKIKPPTDVIFKDENQDKPLENMNELMEQIIKQRNYDLENVINSIPPPPPPSTQSNFLSETSIQASALLTNTNKEEKEKEKEKIQNKHIAWNDTIEENFYIKDVNYDVFVNKHINDNKNTNTDEEIDDDADTDVFDIFNKIKKTPFQTNTDTLTSTITQERIEKLERQIKHLYSIIGETPIE